jgi:hypothetical protein
MFFNILKAFAFLSLIFLSSCFPFNEGICEVESYCTSDEDCVSKYGENYVCYTKYYQPIKAVRKYEPKEYNGEGCTTQINSCIEDKCSNYDCGDLNCIVVDIGSLSKTTCDCEGERYYNPYKKECTEHCSSDSNCDSGYKCNNIHECTLTCDSNEDCKNDSYSDSEYCNTNNHICYVNSY